MRSGVFYSKILIISIIILFFFGVNLTGFNYIDNIPSDTNELASVNKKDLLLLNEHVNYFPFTFQNHLLVAVSLYSQVDILNGSDNWSFGFLLNPIAEGRLVSVASSINKVYFLSLSYTNFSFLVSESADLTSWNSESPDLNLSDKFFTIYSPNLFVLSNGTKIIFFVGGVLGENVTYSIYYSVCNGSLWCNPEELIEVCSDKALHIKVVMVNDNKFLFSYNKKDSNHFSSYLLIWENSTIQEILTQIQFVSEILYLPSGNILYAYEESLPIVESPFVIRFRYFDSPFNPPKDSANFICFEGYAYSCWDPEIILFNNAIHLFYTKTSKYLQGYEWTGFLSYMEIEKLEDELNIPYPSIDIDYEYEKENLQIVLTINRTKSENFMFENADMFFFELLYSNLSSPNMYGPESYGFLDTSLQTHTLPTYQVTNNTASVLLMLVIVSNNHYWHIWFTYSFSLYNTHISIFLISYYAIFGIAIIIMFIDSFKTRQDIKNTKWLSHWSKGNVGQLNLDEVISKIKRSVVFFILLIPAVIVSFYYLREAIETVSNISINISSWLLGAIISYIGLIYAFKGFMYRNMLGERIKAVSFDTISKKETTSSDWHKENEIHIVNVGNNDTYIESISLLVFNFRIPGLFTFDRRPHVKLKEIKPLTKKGFVLKIGSQKIITKTNINKKLNYLVDWKEDSKIFSDKKGLRKLLQRIKKSNIVIKMRFILKPLNRFLFNPIVRIAYGNISKTYIGVGVLKRTISEMEEYLNLRKREELFEKICCIFMINTLEENRILFSENE